jgi:hypothetical protein
VVSSTPGLHFTPGKDPVPIVQEAGWAPGPVGNDGKILPPTGIRSRDRRLHILLGPYWCMSVALFGIRLVPNSAATPLN